MPMPGYRCSTKLPPGYWHTADPQCGYTAISADALRQLDLNLISQGYHFENSILMHLNVINMRGGRVPIRAVYGIGEKSGINHLWALLSFSVYLTGAFLWRLREKYVLRDFHPLVFFYLFGLFFFPVGLLFGGYLVFYRLFVGLVRQLRPYSRWSCLCRACRLHCLPCGLTKITKAKVNEAATPRLTWETYAFNPEVF